MIGIIIISLAIGYGLGVISVFYGEKHVFNHYDHCDKVVF